MHRQSCETVEYEIASNGDDRLMPKQEERMRPSGVKWACRPLLPVSGEGQLASTRVPTVKAVPPSRSHTYSLRGLSMLSHTTYLHHHHAYLHCFFSVDCWSSPFDLLRTITLHCNRLRGPQCCQYIITVCHHVGKAWPCLQASLN